MSPTGNGPRRGRQGSYYEAQNTDAMLAILNTMSSQMEQLVTRREHDALDKRVVSLEEWRLAQTQREADRAAGIQQQIANTQVSAQRQVAQQQTLIDGRTLQWFFTAAMGAGMLILGHLWH